MSRRFGFMIVLAGVLAIAAVGCRKGRSPSDEQARTHAWPWELNVDQPRPSLHDFVQKQLAGKDTLEDTTMPLPDHQHWTARHGRWSPGTYDSLSTWHTDPANDPNALAREMLGRIRDYSLAPGDETKAAVYRLSLEHPTIHYIDQLAAMLGEVSESEISYENVYALGRWLATRSPDREPAKLGISILGWWPGSQDLDTFLRMGKHEAFTLFAAVAIDNTIGREGDESIWELARATHRWGRIQCVWRLDGTTDSRIRDWLLREGFDNDVHIGYTAKTCAETGELSTRLRPGCDAKVFTAGGRLLSALVSTEGPGAFISEIAEGGSLTQRWTQLAVKRASTLRHLASTLFIHSELTDPNTDFQAWDGSDWTPQLRQEAIRNCETIINKPQWQPKIRQALRGDDANEAYLAAWAAELTKLRPFDMAMDRLKRDPTDSAWWYWAGQWADANQMDILLAAADAELPLDEICSRPTTDIGLLENSEACHSLGGLIKGLTRFPGKGAPILERALKGRTLSLRWEAGRTLGAWGKDNWPDGIASAMRAAAVREPDPETQKMFLRVLRGGTADLSAATTQPADQSSGGGS